MPVPRPCGIAPGSARGRGHRLPPEPGHTVGRGGGRGEPRVHLSEGKEQWNARSAGQLRYHDAKKQLQVSKKTKHAAKGWVSLSPLPFPNSNTKTEENPEQSAVWIQEPKQERNRRTQPQEPSKVTICALVQRSTLITGQTVNTFKAGLLVTVKIKNNSNNKKKKPYLAFTWLPPSSASSRTSLVPAGTPYFPIPSWGVWGRAARPHRAAALGTMERDPSGDAPQHGWVPSWIRPRPAGYPQAARPGDSSSEPQAGG